jgi:hypothetical protein
MNTAARFVILTAGLALSLCASAGAGTRVGICAVGLGGSPCPSYVYRPSQIVFGADGRTALVGLRWSQWGARSATARGTLRLDVGPAGRPEYIRHRALVTVWAVRRCGTHRAYLRLAVRSAGRRVLYTGCALE